ncbi:MAG: hypothetical protein U0992_22415, partial [Planctomycetaceae bacterium]
ILRSLTLLSAASAATWTAPAQANPFGIAIVPEQAGDDAGPKLIPPAPEAAQVVVQAADPFQPPAPAVDALATPGDASAAPGSVTIVPLAASSATVNGRSYDEVYRSIPFNHTEYLANPGYRHDATMEILFGTLRPTTIVKDQQPQPIINDVAPLYQPYRWSQSDLWQNRAPALRIFNQGSYWR